MGGRGCKKHSATIGDLQVLAVSAADCIVYCYATNPTLLVHGRRGIATESPVYHRLGHIVDRGHQIFLDLLCLALGQARAGPSRIVMLRFEAGQQLPEACSPVRW